MASINVVLAAPDHHERAAMRAALAGSGVSVAGEACGRWEAGELIRATEPEVAVVDANLLSVREFFLAGWGPVTRDTRIVVVGPDDRGLERRLVGEGVAAYVAYGRLERDLADATIGAVRPTAGTAGSRR